MSEELLQRNLKEKIGTWNFYNIGSTTINQLKKWGIIRSIDYENVERKKVDGIIVEDKSKKVKAVVEFKSPKNFNTQNKKDWAIQQEIEVAKKLGAKLIIATDRQETLWINAETGNSVKDENNKDLKYPFNEKDPDLQKFINEILVSIDKKTIENYQKN